MAFGQPSGSPASAKQVDELLSALHDAGHSDFRDARGPMGFNQRQAAGRFTRDEAAAFIEQLQDGVKAVVVPDGAPSTRRFAPQHALMGVPAEELATELRRRGWMVTEP
jgi:hypothetical protein